MTIFLKLKPLILLFSAIFLNTTFAGAQLNIEEFQLRLRDQNQDRAKSRFQKISVLDQRPDTASVGFIQRGLDHHPLILRAKPSLEQQFNALLTSIVQQDGQQGELLLHLRRFSLNEVFQSTGSTGRLTFRADFYEKTNDGLTKLVSLDTVVVLRATTDVTRKLLKATDRIVADFVANAAVSPSKQTDSIFGIEDLKQTDIISKSKLPLYTAETFPDGVYRSWESFSNLRPDHKVAVRMKNGEISRARITTDKGKFRKLPHMYYAIVWEGKAYLNSRFGHLPIYKFENEFYYHSEISDGREDLILMGWYAGGIIGAAVAGGIADANTSEVDSEILMMLDHQTGRPLPILMRVENSRD